MYELWLTKAKYINRIQIIDSVIYAFCIFFLPLVWHQNLIGCGYNVITVWSGDVFQQGLDLETYQKNGTVTWTQMLHTSKLIDLKSFIKKDFHSFQIISLFKESLFNILRSLWLKKMFSFNIFFLLNLFLLGQLCFNN